MVGARGVNLMGNLDYLGARWQTAFGFKLLTRKTGRVETSDTVEDKNKNVYNYWPAETKAESAPYLGGHDVLPSLRSTFFLGGGDVSPLSPRDLRPWLGHWDTCQLGIECCWQPWHALIVPQNYLLVIWNVHYRLYRARSSTTVMSIDNIVQPSAKTMMTNS